MCVSFFFNFCEGDIGKSARFHARFDRPGLPRQGGNKNQFAVTRDYKTLDETYSHLQCALTSHFSQAQSPGHY
jgi:hypothetical protein